MPEHFNNNGDQGNIEVLSMELKAAKVEHAVVDQIEKADLFCLAMPAERP